MAGAGLLSARTMTSITTAEPISHSATPAAAQRRSRIAGLDGCRALAAFSIVLLHVWQSDQIAIGGPLQRVVENLGAAVPLFFCLSAFLLYTPFAAAIVRGEPRPSLRRYARSRFLRIAPAYWVVLLCVALGLGSAYVRTSTGVGFGRITDPWLLLQNLALVQTYHPSGFLTGLAPAWSLTNEVAFYFALPALVALGTVLAGGRRSRGARRNAALAPAVLMLIVGLCGRFIAWRVLPGPIGPIAGTWHAVFLRSIVGDADLFSFGLALAVIRVEWEDGRLRFGAGWRVVAWTVLLLLGAWAMTYNTVDGASSSGVAYVQQVAFAVCCGLLLGLVVLTHKETSKRFSLVRILDHRLLVFGGLISYSVYLWHFPIVFWLQMHGYSWGGTAGFAATLVLAVLATLVLSILTYRFVERPAMRLRSRHRSRTLGAAVTEGNAIAQPAHAAAAAQAEGHVLGVVGGGAR